MLKIGIVGVGHLGKFHLNNWLEINDVEVVGFVDPNDEVANEVIEKYGIKRFFDTEDFLSRCDAIDIVAPTNYHYEWCEKAIKLGKHVFVEKPFAHTMDEARQLVKLARESNIKL
ncbi:MAG TPA: Gfo/Idh/MocA family oxidoreductase, partial [Niabella sp.]|nr:Gfo/Idh/MocA family oxidoreductase [Niabella sp.]